MTHITRTSPQLRPSVTTHSNATSESRPTTPIAGSPGTLPSTSTGTSPPPSQFDPNAPAHGQQPASPPATLQHQQALNSRRGSLGFTSRAPTPGPSQRPWGLSQSTQHSITNILQELSQDARLTLPVDQSNHPIIKTNHGVCGPMVEKWIGVTNQHGSAQAATAAFGQHLDQNIEHMLPMQQNLDAHLEHVNSTFDRVTTEQLAILERTASDITPLRKKEEQGTLTPAETATLSNLRQAFAAAKAEINGVTAFHQGEHAIVARQLGDGLPHTPGNRNTPMKGETRLDKATHMAQTACEFMADQGVGFYRLSMHPDSGPGHVIGMQVRENADGDHEFKLMDPNTGEFSADDFETLGALVARHAVELDYAKDFTKFTLDHYAAAPH
ncbi:hypothetical protein MYSTI_01560 [Myxococcus stipitatus DSM 14675]|uniref:Peptidase C58 YopT-type domain-containing protein n=1 Tax=Myxococcus stipitatus (strain DSM 14675 / JCM 12634 / Mx s8) TaxID=1278073 RepID=L7U4Y7_MYXSD|nr:hypothetical protein [Myxococcus stipitatus]AGC42895.1 hypothetical protein MYSTI_01560 [Myxococcus stipitatus DSM 14675]